MPEVLAEALLISRTVSVMVPPNAHGETLSGLRIIPTLPLRDPCQPSLFSPPGPGGQSPPRRGQAPPDCSNTTS